MTLHKVKKILGLIKLEHLLVIIISNVKSSGNNNEYVAKSSYIWRASRAAHAAARSEVVKRVIEAARKNVGQQSTGAKPRAQFIYHYYTGSRLRIYDSIAPALDSGPRIL